MVISLEILRISKILTTGVVNTLTKDSKNDSLYKLYNIGNGKPVQLLDFIESLEKVLGYFGYKKNVTHASG